MADHNGIRAQSEQQLATAIERVFDRYGAVEVERIPWSELENELAAVIQEETAAAFALIWLAMLDEDPGLGLLMPAHAPDLARAAGGQYAAGRARDVAAGFVSGAREQVSRKAAAGVVPADIWREIATPGRAERIAVTETTKTITEAETAVYRDGRGAAGLTGKQLGVWHTAEDEGVCPTCRPLDGTPRETWERVLPGGPPAHPNCRCWIEWEPLAVAPE